MPRSNGRNNNGNNSGGGGNNNGGSSRRTKLQKRAVRDVRLSERPQVRQLQQAQQGTETAYGGFQDLLAPMGKQYGNQTEDIAGNLTSQLAALSGMLGGDTPVASSALPAGEAQAGANMGTQLGAGSLGLLASQAQRNLGYQQSAVREGGLAERSALDNLTQQMSELFAQRPEQIRQRMDELRQQNLENSLVKSQMQGDAAYVEFLKQYIGGMDFGGGKGGGRGTGGGGGDPWVPPNVHADTGPPNDGNNNTPSETQRTSTRRNRRGNSDRRGRR